MYYNKFAFCKQIRHIKIITKMFKCGSIEQNTNYIGKFLFRAEKYKVLHQVALECFIALKIGIDKVGSDVNAVVGINHSGRLAVQPYGLVFGG